MHRALVDLREWAGLEKVPLGLPNHKLAILAAKSSFVVHFLRARPVERMASRRASLVGETETRSGTTKNPFGLLTDLLLYLSRAPHHWFPYLFGVAPSRTPTALMFSVMIRSQVFSPRRYQSQATQFSPSISMSGNCSSSDRTNTIARPHCLNFRPDTFCAQVSASPRPKNRAGGVAYCWPYGRSSSQNACTEAITNSTWSEFVDLSPMANLPAPSVAESSDWGWTHLSPGRAASFSLKPPDSSSGS